MIRGRSAERAVQFAAVTYRKQGRADVTKQATGMRKYGAQWKFTTKSPIDFRGTIAGTGQSLALEVKEHDGSSFPLSEDKLPGKQRDALDVALRMGGQVWLIVDLRELDECYAVHWSNVQTFLRRPTRASLSLSWLRAFGYLVRTSGRGTDDFRIWFLELSVHPLQAGAICAEEIEAQRPVIELDRVIEKPPTRITQTKEQRLAGVRDAIEHGKYRKNAKGWAK